MPRTRVSFEMRQKARPLRGHPPLKGEGKEEGI
ncbi:hypothetical protein L611_002500000250 [Aminobacter sp. J15]|nr:hypothetical protein L610_001900000230 [Aminobacter sp. J44]TWH31589.1 hypothetical protein L611_002500000250 [Aminobacter sp. J15]